MTSPFERKYTDLQRDAVLRASVDRGVSAPRIVNLAASGQLPADNGVWLPAFNVPINTVREWRKKELRKRAGADKKGITDVPHRDAVEALRRRLVAFAEVELDSMERAQKRQPGKADLQRASGIVRLVREAAALPGPDDPRPKAPGARGPDGAKRTEGTTRHGLAGEILRAHRAEGTTATDDTTHHQRQTENGSAAAEAKPFQREQGLTENEPGSLAITSDTVRDAITRALGSGE